MENNDLILRLPSQGEMEEKIKEAISNIEGRTIAAAITDDQEMEAATDLYVNGIKTAKKLLDGARRFFKDPIADQAAAVDAFFKPYIAKLEELEADLSKKMRVYKAEQDRKAAELERQLREQELAEAKRLQAIEDAKAAEQNRPAEEVKVMLPTVQKAPTMVRSAGAAAIFTKRWTFEVTDPKLVPAEYLMPDTVKIGQVVRRADSPVREIPGVRIYQEDGVSGRRTP